MKSLSNTLSCSLWLTDAMLSTSSSQSASCLSSFLSSWCQSPRVSRSRNRCRVLCRRHCPVCIVGGWPLKEGEYNIVQCHSNRTCTRIRRKNCDVVVGWVVVVVSSSSLSTESLTTSQPARSQQPMWANKKAGRCDGGSSGKTEKNHTKCIFHKSLFPCPTKAAEHETSQSRQWIVKASSFWLHHRLYDHTTTTPFATSRQGAFKLLICARVLFLFFGSGA